mgnify:CR=1 FL=1
MSSNSTFYDESTVQNEIINLDIVRAMNSAFLDSDIFITILKKFVFPQAFEAENLNDGVGLIHRLVPDLHFDYGILPVSCPLSFKKVLAALEGSVAHYLKKNETLIHACHSVEEYTRSLILFEIVTILSETKVQDVKKRIEDKLRSLDRYEMLTKAITVIDNAINTESVYEQKACLIKHKIINLELVNTN